MINNETREMVEMEHLGMLPKDVIFEAPKVEKVKPAGGYDYIYQRNSGVWLCFRVLKKIAEWRWER